MVQVVYIVNCIVLCRLSLQFTDITLTISPTTRIVKCTPYTVFTAVKCPTASCSRHIRKQCGVLV